MEQQATWYAQLALIALLAGYLFYQIFLESEEEAPQPGYESKLTEDVFVDPDGRIVPITPKPSEEKKELKPPLNITRVAREQGWNPLTTVVAYTVATRKTVDEILLDPTILAGIRNPGTFLSQIATQINTEAGYTTETDISSFINAVAPVLAGAGSGLVVAKILATFTASGGPIGFVVGVVVAFFWALVQSPDKTYQRPSPV